MSVLLPLHNLFTAHKMIYVFLPLHNLFTAHKTMPFFTISLNPTKTMSIFLSLHYVLTAHRMIFNFPSLNNLLTYNPPNNSCLWIPLQSLHSQHKCVSCHLSMISLQTAQVWVFSSLRDLFTASISVCLVVSPWSLYSQHKRLSCHLSIISLQPAQVSVLSSLCNLFTASKIVCLVISPWSLYSHKIYVCVLIAWQPTRYLFAISSQPTKWYLFSCLLPRTKWGTCMPSCLLTISLQSAECLSISLQSLWSP